MSDVPDMPKPALDKQRRQVRQLAHDMRSSLSIISMCLQLLDDARQDDADFGELCEMMQSKGVDSLTKLIDSMVEIATLSETGPGSQISNSIDV